MWLCSSGFNNSATETVGEKDEESTEGVGRRFHDEYVFQWPFHEKVFAGVSFQIIVVGFDPPDDCAVRSDLGGQAVALPDGLFQFPVEFAFVLQATVVQKNEQYGEYCGCGDDDLRVGKQSDAFVFRRFFVASD